MIDITQEIIGSSLRIATPLALAALGELVTEKSGVLNLGVEGIMYGSAFVGIATAAHTGSLTTGLIAALVTGAAAGLIFAFLTVTLGVNQHVAGLGLTLFMISFSNSANRIMFTSDGGQVRVDPWRPIDFGGPIFSQYWITYATFLIIVPLTWWLMRRSGLGLKIRAVGENPEAADVAGIDVTKTRYTAILIGSIYMAAGGAFITLAFVGSFTINIIN